MNTYKKNINGINYVVKVEDVFWFQSQSLWRAISNIPVDSLKDGYKIEIGFSLYFLKKTDTGYTIVAPDYMTTPFFNTTQDLTLAFWIQTEQFELLKKYNIDGITIRFDDEIAVSKEALMKHNICLQRFEDLGGSGWCINEIKLQEDGKFSSLEAEDYELYYAYQLLSIRPELLKILMLPYNYIVIFEGNKILDILNEDDKSIICE